MPETLYVSRMINRRVFIKSTFSAGLISALPFRFDRMKMLEAGAQSLDSAHPIQVLPPNAVSSRVFNGDIIERTHEILWNIDGFVAKNGGWPEPTETTNVVVVGGGVAGLTSAYFLRDEKPIVFEQAENFGGNSRGEQLNGSRYAIGGAYLAAPDKNSVTARLLTELKLLSQIRAEDAADMSVMHINRLAEGFWRGNTAPEAKVQFMRVFNTLKRLKGKLGLNARLDQMTFTQWLAQEFGNLHPHILEYFQLYAWSAFAGSMEEISALQFLDFATADTGALLALPGGNSAITGRLYEALRTSLGPSNMRNNCLVLDVRIEGNGVRVTYADPKNRLRAIRAKHVVYAAPKFVAKHTVHDLSAAQKKAMNDIDYRAYIVANVFLRKPFKAPTFSLYCLQNQVPKPPAAMAQDPRPFTDICFGTWAQNDRTQTPVLTVYKAYPFDGARQLLFNPAAHDKIRRQILTGLEPVFTGLNLKSSDIAGIRMTRWGHSLPLASPGMVANGTAQLASQTIAGRIHFANQDNWVNPSFETAADAAFAAAKAVKGVR